MPVGHFHLSQTGFQGTSGRHVFCWRGLLDGSLQWFCFEIFSELEKNSHLARCTFPPVTFRVCCNICCPGTPRNSFYPSLQGNNNKLIKLSFFKCVLKTHLITYMPNGLMLGSSSRISGQHIVTDTARQDALDFDISDA